MGPDRSMTRTPGKARSLPRAASMGAELARAAAPVGACVHLPPGARSVLTTPMGVVTYCRICPATCGLVVEVEGGRAVAVQGDPDNPLSRGFTCTKGRHYGHLHHDPARFLT